MYYPCQVTTGIDCCSGTFVRRSSMYVVELVFLWEEGPVWSLAVIVPPVV